MIKTTMDLSCEYEVIDLLMNIQIKSRNAFSQMGASFKSMFGGKIGSYDKLFKDIREEAIMCLEQEAVAKGADAIIGIRFESAEVASINAFQVCVYGTAVKIKK